MVLLSVSMPILGYFADLKKEKGTTHPNSEKNLPKFPGVSGGQSTLNMEPNNKRKIQNMSEPTKKVLS